MEWREVYVVSRAFSDFAQQNPVNPINDGTIQFSRPVKSQPVLIEICDENILHLQKAARMEQRNSVLKTFERTRTCVKT